MEIFFVLNILLLKFAVSLGVGASTVTVVSFLVAIKDCVVDESEKRNLAVMFKILRVAMGVILVTLSIYTYQKFTSEIVLTNSAYTNNFLSILWTLVVFLYGNAILMSKHLIPKTIGPGIQAASWYTLGVTVSLPAFLFTTNIHVLLTALGVWFVVVFTVVTSWVVYFVRKTKKDSC